MRAINMSFLNEDLNQAQVVLSKGYMSAEPESKRSKTSPKRSKTSNAQPTKPTHPVTAPIDSIRICMLGCVSAGKTTTLEALFLSEEKLSQTGMKRTTMVPTLFVESTEPATANIHELIAAKNKDLITRSEKGEVLTLADCKEMVFSVGKLDMSVKDPIAPCTVYDIPGINDARTKSVYYEYINKTFPEFNIIMFIVDINSGLNTADEMEIVQMLARNTKECLEKHKKKVYTLVLVNKVDDMEMLEKGGEPQLTGEYKEMFDQVNHTMQGEFTKVGMLDHLIAVIPMCSHDAYIYRMVSKYGDRFKLSDEQILKIGINEQGKKFSKKTPEERRAEIKKIVTDKKFVKDMIHLSGFQRVKERFNTHYLRHGQTMLVENVDYELSKHPTLTTVIQQANNLLTVPSLLNYGTCLRIMKYVQPNAEFIASYFASTFDSVCDVVKSKLVGYTNLTSLLTDFASFRAMFNSAMEDTLKLPEFPLFVVELSVPLMLNDIKTAFDPMKLTDHLSTLNSMNRADAIPEVCNAYFTQYAERIAPEGMPQFQMKDTPVESFQDLFVAFAWMDPVDALTMYRTHVLYVMTRHFSSSTMIRLSIEILKPAGEYYISTLVDLCGCSKMPMSTFVSARQFTSGPEFDFVRSYCKMSAVMAADIAASI